MTNLMSFESLLPESERTSAVQRPIVSVQGLGFVGAAMAIAVASASNKEGSPIFNVIGVDLANSKGNHAISCINDGCFPMQAEDASLGRLTNHARHITKNLIATTDSQAFALADIVIVDVNLDVENPQLNPSVDFSAFETAIDTIAQQMSEDTLVVVETTVPPGTCEKIVTPRLRAGMSERKLNPDNLLLAHSYERVMPGSDYLNSITNFWRVYSATSDKAADRCEAFLTKVVNTKDFPLTRLPSTTASELAKVMENSYRAINIALIEEWGEFATTVGVDLMDVLDAIRMRPTHNNIRQPGFGVGGYCLTKDPAFGQIASKQLFGNSDVNFPFSNLAVRVNEAMPITALDHLKEMLGGSLKAKTILVLGVSYRQDVSDTRYSPSETFVRTAQNRGALVKVHDPIVRYWEELKIEIPASLPNLDGNFDAVVFAVPHAYYLTMDHLQWLGSFRPVIFDACRILTKNQSNELRGAGFQVRSIGSGEHH
jgi:UDP-N-acetyl-D-glucosamine dehydrogenase